MKDRIEEEIVRYLWRLTPVIGEEGAEPPRRCVSLLRDAAKLTLSGPSAGACALAIWRDPRRRLRQCRRRSTASRPDRRRRRDQQVKREEPKVGRNDPCPCGSGKKYKKCHGA